MCGAVAVALLLLSLTSAKNESAEIISIHSEQGQDGPLCPLNSSAVPCKTLSYVLNDTAHLSETIIVLEGNQRLNDTVTVKNVEALTIKGTEESQPVIYCELPSDSLDEGAGLVFQNVTNLSILHVGFQDCGTLQVSTTLREGVNVKYRSAVYIINSTDILISEVKFNKNPGKGLSLFDVSGSVVIRNSIFTENMVPMREIRTYFGGGGISIEFTHCTPGVSQCNQFENSHNKNSNYTIQNCTFSSNRATNDEIAAQIHIVQFRKLTGSDGNNAGQGGGIHITMKGTATENSIRVLDCVFESNSAQYGGGVDAVIQDNSLRNRVTIVRCTFTNNSALERSGGALNVGYTSGSRVRHNTIRLEDTNFINNSAGRGGAVSFFSSRIKTPATNRLEFVNCTWLENSASIGAAVSLRPTAGSSLFDGEPPTPLLQKCTFVRNQVVSSAAFLTSARDRATQHFLETGAVHIESIEVQLKDFASFSENVGSAIAADSSQINILSQTEVHFVRNRASYGGAMALLGFSILQLYSGSQVVFDSNKASELGGAVYATSPHQTEFIFSHKCFFSYKASLHPDNWNTSLTFTNNIAQQYGHDIYADSLLPCAKNVFDITTNVSSALFWTPFNFTTGIKNFTIATSPATVSFSLPEEIAPGEPINIKSVSMDDLGQIILSSYQVFIEGSVDTNHFVSDNSYLHFTGHPGGQFNLTLRTQNTRQVSLSKPGRLGNCPLGLVLDDSRCVCSSQTRYKQLYGIPGCEQLSFRALIIRNFWIGCIGNIKVATGQCPLGYCHPQSADNEPLYAPKTCTEHFPCASNRRGRLCGDCDEGYTAHFHSNSFVCERCPHGALGLLIYALAELLPLFLLFSVIVMMKIRMTSGPLQSLVFFAQMTTLNCSPTTSTVQHVFARIHSSLLGFLSLDFLKMDELSYCLWEGATVLNNLLFNYLTTLFTFLLIFTYIMSVRHNTNITKLICWEPARKIIGKMKVFKNAVVHGISTFLILTYTQYTILSFQILSRVKLYGEGVETVATVVRFQGSVDYFGIEHLPYAIPAVLVLVFLSLPPPLLLISYPLLWKIKARLRRNETGDDRTVWFIRRLLPLIDSFQGVFRDNRRMFAGLLFLWRVILTAITALTTNQG